MTSHKQDLDELLKKLMEGHIMLLPEGMGDMPLIPPMLPGAKGEMENILPPGYRPQLPPKKQERKR